MARRDNPAQLSLLDLCPASVLAPVPPERKAIVATAKAAVKRAQAKAEPAAPKSKKVDTTVEDTIREFAAVDLLEAIRRSLPNSIPLPYQKLLDVSLEQRPDDMRPGRMLTALVGRFLMFDGEEGTCVITGTFQPSYVTTGGRNVPLRRLDHRDFTGHSWPQLEVPFGWDTDLRQWRRYPEAAEALGKLKARIIDRKAKRAA